MKNSRMRKLLPVTLTLLSVVMLAILCDGLKTWTIGQKAAATESIQVASGGGPVPYPPTNIGGGVEANA